MRSFLLKNGKPLVVWGLIPDHTLYEGKIPEGYDLAINPHEPYIIIDVDRHGKKDGFDYIPIEIQKELNLTFNYPTKNNGRHYWIYYTGNKTLPNKASGIGIDLRVWNTSNTNGGYVKWHPRNAIKIKDVLWSAQPSSKNLNKWIENLFYYKKYEKRV